MSKPRSHKHEFSVATKDRVYNLFAETKAIKNQWLKAFNQIITLKSRFKYELERLTNQTQNVHSLGLLAFDKNMRGSHALPYRNNTTYIGPLN